MKLLVLGGNAWLSRTVAEHALAAGHDVTCANRSGGSPGIHVRWDRADAVPQSLLQHWDAVIDVSRDPEHVRRAVAALGDAHWVFVSTASVYEDAREPGGTTDAPTLDPVGDGYGELKVACEDAVRAGARTSTIVRPGLIVGPGDPSGRFAYWASRVGARVLVPGRPDDPVQFIDVRDLAAWIVELAERQHSGAFDAVCPPITKAEFMTALDAEPVYATGLLERGVTEWAGPDSIALWIDDPAMAGFLARDVRASTRAGLRIRPLIDTVRDTAAWLASTPDAPITGISRERELELLG